MSTYPKPPQILTDAGLSLFVHDIGFRDLDLPIISIPIKTLLWHLDLPVWEKDGTDDWNLTPRQVIEREMGTDEHYQRVLEADLSYPILVTEYNKHLVILDGIHRLVKAFLENRTTIRAKRIPREHLVLRTYST
jgi:hypothetical protein